MDSHSTSDSTANNLRFATMQIALAEALKAKGAALRDLAAIQDRGRDADGLTHVVANQTDASISSKCYFLEIIPLEIRNMIYSNLLVKDILSDSRSLPALSDYELPGTTYTTYDLSPGLLRTCQQIHDEASAVLYHDNTFIFDFQPSLGWVSPLNREPHSINLQGPMETWEICFADVESLFSHPHLPKVRHWKVIVGTDGTYEEPAPPTQPIFELCKLLRKVQPQTLKVVVAPLNSLRHVAGLDGPWQNPSLRSLLRPFTHLRNLVGFELVQGTVEDLFKNPPSGHGNQPIYKSHKGFKKLKIELETLIRSDQPPIAIINVYENLMHYAQAFERNNVYKSEMSPGYEDVLQQIRLTQGDLRSSFVLSNAIPVPSDLEILKAGSYRHHCLEDNIWCQVGSEKHYSKPKSPFKALPYHPVETALEKASYAWEVDNIDLLKEARREVIDYLEPQYQRVAAASLSFNEFVKNLKRHPEILSPQTLRYQQDRADSRRSHEDRALLTLMAEKYAQSFKRDIPPSMELAFRLRRTEFTYAYSQLPRELLLTKMNELLEVQGPYSEVIHAFKNVADDMDAQYLEIRNARKALFDHDDSADYGVNIDLEATRCDDMVDWTVAEPDIYIEKKPVNALAIGGPFNPTLMVQQMNNAVQNLVNALPLYIPAANANPPPPAPNGPLGQAGNAPTAAPNAAAPATNIQYAGFNLYGPFLLPNVVPQIPAQAGNPAPAQPPVPAANTPGPAPTPSPVPGPNISTTTVTTTTFQPGNSTPATVPALFGNLTVSPASSEAGVDDEEWADSTGSSDEGENEYH